MFVLILVDTRHLIALPPTLVSPSRSRSRQTLPYGAPWYRVRSAVELHEARSEERGEEDGTAKRETRTENAIDQLSMLPRIVLAHFA
jgi:hypothetical protein